VLLFVQAFPSLSTPLLKVWLPARTVLLDQLPRESVPLLKVLLPDWVVLFDQAPVLASTPLL
jgi:hypothetical protein